MLKAIGKIRKLWSRFADKDYRNAFMEARLRESVAAQVYFIRESRKMTQGELAALAGTKQPAISRIERGDASLSLKSLEAIARSFDVALSVKFVPHSDIIDEVINGRLESYVPPYSDDIPDALALHASPNKVQITSTRWSGNSSLPQVTSALSAQSSPTARQLYV